MRILSALLLSVAFMTLGLSGCGTVRPGASYVDRSHGLPAAQLHIVPQSGFRFLGDSEALSVDELTCGGEGLSAFDRRPLASWYGLIKTPEEYDASLPAGRVFFYYESATSHTKRWGRLTAMLEAGHKYRFKLETKFINILKGSSFTPTLVDVDSGAAVDIRVIPSTINNATLCTVMEMGARAQAASGVADATLSSGASSGTGAAALSVQGKAL